MKPTELRSNRNIVHACQYHVIWCPKYRRRVLVCGVDAHLKDIIQDEAIRTSSEVLELEVMPDHVHLLVRVDPVYGVHRLVKRLKGVSSRVLRSRFPGLRERLPSLWTNSYFVSTVGGAPLAVVKQYIEQQKSA